jgi:hypothetical protein
MFLFSLNVVSSGLLIFKLRTVTCVIRLFSVRSTAMVFHIGMVDFLRWKTLPTNWRFDTGTAHLWIYKTAWLVYHRNMLKNRLRKPKSLYCCWLVSLQQRGTPERFKSVGVLQVRQILELSRREDKALSNATSVGSIAIQLGVAASTMGIRPDKLTSLSSFSYRIVCWIIALIFGLSRFICAILLC